MTRVTAVIVLLVLYALPTRSTAQSWEVGGLVGNTPSAGIDQRAPEVEELDWQGRFTWGLQGANFFTPRLGAELLWVQQQSGLKLGTSSGTATLFEATTSQLHGNLVYRLRNTDAKLQPFVFGGAGATFFRADDLDSETKFSWDVGAGVSYFGWGRLGVRGHVRYKPTLLNDESAGRFCDPFGFCQGTLQQIEIAAGAVYRF